MRKHQHLEYCRFRKPDKLQIVISCIPSTRNLQYKYEVTRFPVSHSYADNQTIFTCALKEIMFPLIQCCSSCTFEERYMQLFRMFFLITHILDTAGPAPSPSPAFCFTDGFESSISGVKPIWPCVLLVIISSSSLSTTNFGPYSHNIASGIPSLPLRYNCLGISHL